VRFLLTMQVGVLKRNLLLLVLAILVISSSIAPSIAQESLVTYNVHVDFFYAYCSLSNLVITLGDQSGRVVASTQIPDAYEVTLTYSTVTATSSLTVTVFAQASIGSFYAGSVSGSRTIPVGNGGDYWTTVQLR
jgi:hypothetical protein